MAIKIDDLAMEVNRQLQAFAGATDEVVKASVDAVVKETIAQLKATSPELTGVYAKSWESTKIKEGKHSYIKVIHAGDGEYRLTHLLENGHNVVRGGKIVGRANPHPHIQPAEQAAIDEFEKKLRKGVEAITK